MQLPTKHIIALKISKGAFQVITVCTVCIRQVFHKLLYVNNKFCIARYLGNVLLLVNTNRGNGEIFSTRVLSYNKRLVILN